MRLGSITLTGSTDAGGNTAIPLSAELMSAELGFGTKLSGAMRPMLPIDAIPAGPRAAERGSDCEFAFIIREGKTKNNPVLKREAFIKTDSIRCGKAGLKSIPDTWPIIKHAKSTSTFIGTEFLNLVVSNSWRLFSKKTLDQTTPKQHRQLSMRT
jgi:hypothetical protein